jgi:dipeptidyl aminopeptidase/acylaminoacyl peptidase
MMIPLSHLFGLPSIEAPSLSPNGQTIAALRRGADGVAVVRRDLVSGSETVVAQFPRRPLEIRMADEHTVLVLADAEGSERPELLVYQAQGQPQTVKGLPPGYLTLPENPMRGDRLIVYAATDSGLGLNCLAVQRDGWLVSDTLGANDGSILQWLTDPSGHLVARIRRLADGSGVVEVRDSGGWAVARRLDRTCLGASRLVAVKGSHLYLTEYRGDTLALCRGDTVLVQNGRYDIGRVLTDPVSGQPELAEVIGTGRELHPLTDKASQLVAALPEGAQVLSISAGLTCALVRVESPAAPPELAVVTADARRVDLGCEFEELSGAALAPRLPFAFEARDGLRIEGYLTLPRPEQALPRPSAVVMAHGGPWSRKDPGFDPEAQWLANRGYAVAQINFRGSAGYGLEFLQRGFRDWGGAMQDDVDDAARWLIEQGHADPREVALLGGSYGGYVAAFAAVRGGFAYRCTLAFSPPVDLPALVASIPAHWGAYGDLVRERVGDPDRDAAALRERSPLYRIGGVPIPMLIAHGANDPYVPKAPTDEFVQKLRDAGGHCVYLQYGSEGHDLLGLDEEMAFYAAADKFLAAPHQHGGTSAAPP